MPYNTKTIKRDSQNIPVPQIFNPSIDDFSALTGVDLGGGRVGADNLMWGKTAGGLYVPVKVSDAGAVATELTGSNLRQTQIGTDQTATWANSAAANTQVSVTITKPTVPVGEYELIIYNPSTVTDLTVKVFAVETALGGGTRDALVTTVSIPKSQSVTGTTINTQAKFLHGIFNASDCKLVLSNDLILGASDGFSAYVRLREVN